MRLGGPIYGEWQDAAGWAALVGAHGYHAAYAPIRAGDPIAPSAYAQAAAAAGIVIAEVGAWGNNPLSTDPVEAAASIARCQERLALAEEFGARCCVNVAGIARHALGRTGLRRTLPTDTFALIVDTVRAIIDAVQPTRTAYALEVMPWIFPDTPDTYVALVEAIDRPAFGVHLDPVNFIASPRRFYGNAALIREACAKLGPLALRSCHAKDIAFLDERGAVQFEEVRPGLGGLDYRTFLTELDHLAPDLPLMLEHLPTAEEYAAAATHLRGCRRRTARSRSMASSLHPMMTTHETARGILPARRPRALFYGPQTTGHELRTSLPPTTRLISSATPVPPPPSRAW